jgi:hypothetical protein
MLRRVALVRTGVSEDALSSSEISVLTRATRHNIPEDPILHSHRRENLNSYTEDLSCERQLTESCWVRDQEGENTHLCYKAVGPC